MYTYNEFKNYVKDNIMELLPYEYDGAEVKFNDIKKSDGYNYEALMITPNSDEQPKIVPALNLTEAFKKYESGEPIDRIVADLAEVRVHAKIPGEDIKNQIMDFQNAKERIFPRLVNTAANADYLSDKPHVDIEDLSMMFAVRIHEDPKGFAEAIIDDNLMEMWGTDPTEIHDAAIGNMAGREPFFANIEDVLFSGGVSGMAHEDFNHIEDINPEEYSMPFYVLSNAQKTKGAVMVMDQKTMSQITDKLGEVYIIPSSVDEVLIVPKAEIDDVSHLNDMVCQVNNDAVAPQDRLSDHVYEYDSQNQTLVMAGAPSQGEVQSM